MRPSDSEYISETSNSYISTCESGDGGYFDNWTDADYKGWSGSHESDSSSPEDTNTSELSSSSLTEDYSNYTDPYSSDEDLKFKLVTRRRWKALPPGETAKRVPHLQRPIGLVWFIYSTESEPCYELEDCKRSVRSLQQTYMQHIPDIPFNFLIGGDGKVYEGRGWKKRPPNTADFPDEDTNRIDIGYLGNFKRGELTTKMLKGGLDLVSHGIHNNLLANNYDSREWEKPGVPQPENMDDIFKKSMF